MKVVDLVGLERMVSRWRLKYGFYVPLAVVEKAVKDFTSEKAEGEW